MMDADLARELREATDQLLDIAPPQPSTAFPASPHLQHRSRPTPTRSAARPAPKQPAFSSTSKLELLHSPTDVRPWQWPTPPTTAADTDLPRTPSPSAPTSRREPIKIKLGADVLDDADDNLPARGLSSRIASVRGSSTSHDTRVARGNIAEDDDDLRASSPSKLRVRTPVNDIYINQYGERVVQGRVVGRILGGRPRPPSQADPISNSSTDSAAEQTISPELQPHSTQLSTTRSPSTMASGGVASASSPPAFFLESFPDAFAPAPITTSPAKDKVRKVSKGGPPSILKAPRAVAGALTLANSDNVDDPVLVRDASFHTATELGSPTSVSSKQLSPPPTRAKLAAVADVDSGLAGLRLDAPDAPKRSAASTPLLSPNEGAATSDSTRGRLELDSFRRPTPTIELSQAKTEPVVLHGNRRQARASGIGSPPSTSPGEAESLSMLHRDSNHERDWPSLERRAGTCSGHARNGSASEPTSPLMSPRYVDDTRGHHGDGVDLDEDDAGSIESAPSSLISLPVSTVTTSSRTPSHASLERRRSGGSATFSSPASRRRSVRRSEGDERFAREVRIRGWSEVGSQARGWVVFEIVLTTLQATHIVAHRRFSSFVNLRRALLQECPEHAKWLPRLPTRTTGLLNKYDARYLEKRRMALQTWLERVVLDKVWGSAEALREWILASD